MQSLRLFDHRIWVTALASWFLAYIFNGFILMASDKLSFLLALPVVGLFCVAMVIKPRGFLIAFLLVRPLLDNFLNLTRINASGEDIGIGALLNMALIVLTIFLAFYHSSFPRKNPVVLSWIIFLLVLMVTLFHSPFLGGGIRLFFNFLSYFAMFLIPFLVIESQKDAVFWLKILGWSFLVPILGADVDLVRGGHHFIDAGSRIMGTFTHPNILAFYLVLGFNVFLYMLKSKELQLGRGLRTVMMMLMANMLILLIATKTRNAWLAFLAGLLIYGLLKDKKVLLILIAIVGCSLLIPQIQERVLNILQNKEVADFHGLNSFEWRMRMWKSTVPKIIQNPIAGYGLASFRPMSVEFSSVVFSQGMGAHNAYLEIMFETGLFGLLSFLALFLTPMVLFFKNMRAAIEPRQAQQWALLIGYVISYMIICSADNLSYYLVFNWYVWFFLGLVLCMQQKRGVSNG